MSLVSAKALFRLCKSLRRFRLLGSLNVTEFANLSREDGQLRKKRFREEYADVMGTIARGLRECSVKSIILPGDSGDRTLKEANYNLLRSFICEG